MSERDINDMIGRNISYYLETKNKNQDDFAEFMGVSQATISNWCTGTKLPRMNKIDKICEFFGISRTELMSERDNISDQEHYYLNEDAREMAQFMFENPEYKVLFDASRNVKKEDIEFVKRLIDKFRD